MPPAPPADFTEIPSSPLAAPPPPTPYAHTPEKKSPVPSTPQWRGRNSTGTVPPPPGPAGSKPVIKPVQFRAPKEENSEESLSSLYRKAREGYDRIDSYIVRLTRQEWLKGKLQPREIIYFKYRKKPASVYMKWLGEEGKGREVVYVEGQHDNKMHVKVAAGDIPLVPAGRQWSFSPDNVLVKNNSRHDIREAGIGSIIQQFGDLLQASQSGDTSKGTATYLGLKPRKEFPAPLECIEWNMPPGLEKALPKGGRRRCYLDPAHHLPTLIITEDEKGQMVEYYRYDRFQFPVNLDAADFDPKVIWTNGNRSKGKEK